MIWESKPWKDALLRDAKMLKRWASATTITEYRETQYERKIFIAAYTIRKLIEANKISNYITNMTLSCRRYNKADSNIDLMNWHSIDRHYVLNEPIASDIRLTQLVNILIHSYAFILEYDESGTIGFLVTSDRTKDKYLIGVSLPDFISIMESIGANYPASIHMIRDEQTGDFNVYSE